ncbi:heptaprenylglyceryl phosphate synthase [Brevibacillus panacihumi]|uniref:Heptaprenylglyceryl phosphate synthase n=1 Tax=Brevibacillus panacihumi TaxID=497735 RepID=A0A3M8CP84_9BACL|nr:heptaprenylglyceryl phosphate synthase [Brevibacillus panacihumi]RNB77117.1 heptaprenylglyceryl phosphate synthase [Brevibacillus panacihumi]
MIDYRGWRHTFKLDPDKTIGDAELEAICESGTDAIIVGGTYGVTYDNTLELMSRIRRYAVPTILEISSLEAVVPGFDSYFVPLVINAGDPDMIFAPHVSGLLAYGSYIHWDEIITEGYLIANPEAGAAKRTQARPIADSATAKAYAQVATQICRLPIVYLEYSGQYGDPEVVRGCKAGVHEAHFFYGGGIRTPQQAAEMADIADTVVVGNLVYEDVAAALATVAAVKGS